MESDRAPSTWQSWRPRKNGPGQSIVCECSVLDCKDRRSLAGFARPIRAVEYGLQTILPMVQTRSLGTTAPSARRRRRAIEPIARFDDGPSPPTRGGRKRGQVSQALGRSSGGFSTKIHVAVSGDGQPVKLHLTEGRLHDVTCAEILLDGLEPEFVIADKGYDSDPLRNEIRSIGAKPVIPSRRTHRIRRHDRQWYKLRNVVERFINKIKNCRRVATRYDILAVTSWASSSSHQYLRSH
jgi:transposase